MPYDIEILADEWEAYCADMASMQEELFLLWCSDMEKEHAN